MPSPRAEIILSEENQATLEREIIRKRRPASHCAPLDRRPTKPLRPEPYRFFPHLIRGFPPIPTHPTITYGSSGTPPTARALSSSGCPGSQPSPRRGAMPLRILIAEDQLMVRQGLNALLEQAGFEVVGGASDGREALRLVKELHPEVVIMDLSMPVTNGLETARKIRKILPTTEVILLTVHDEDQYVLEAMRDGVSGYVLKSRALEDLVRAIHEVSEHRVYLSPGISDVVVRAYMAKASIAPDLLSDRERQ